MQSARPVGVSPCIVVDTPGLLDDQPGLPPIGKRRWIHPEDVVPEPSPSARLF